MDTNRGGSDGERAALWSRLVDDLPHAVLACRLDDAGTLRLAAANAAAGKNAPKMAGMQQQPPPQTVGGALLGLCTPRDMETSPTLTFVGCLQDKNAPGKR